MTPRRNIFARAGPLALEVQAEAAEELIALKAGDLFLCTRPDGDISPGGVSGEGLFSHDTRFLCAFKLQIGNRGPVPLSYTTEAGSRAVIDATNPQLPGFDGDEIHQMALSIRRSLVLDDRLYCRLRVRSFWPRPVRTELALSLAADFADVFELRGFPRREARGHMLSPETRPDGASIGYVGEDDIARQTLVSWDRRPAELDVGADRIWLSWGLAIEPGTEQQLTVTIEPVLAGRRGPRRTIEAARRRGERAETVWRRGCTTITSANELFDRWLETSATDLHALMTPMAGFELPAAGVPWYVAPFGRDSLLTCYQAMLLAPGLARGTLLALSALQARTDDPWRDAEPGKILHELRRGELAGTGVIPHTPYYGTVDATPLFIALAAEYFRWTQDLATIRTRCGRRLDAALAMDRRARRPRTATASSSTSAGRRRGLVNQGWKDSHDAIIHADGRLAQGPIALSRGPGLRLPG